MAFFSFNPPSKIALFLIQNIQNWTYKNDFNTKFGIMSSKKELFWLLFICEYN